MKTELARLKTLIKRTIAESLGSRPSTAALDVAEALGGVGLELADEDDPVEIDGDVEVVRAVGPPYSSARYRRGFVDQLEDALRTAGFSGSVSSGFSREDALAEIVGLDGDPEDDPAPWIELTAR